MSEWSIPDSVEEVTGYRVWDLTESGELRAVNSGYGHWEPGTNEAVCQRPPHVVRKNSPEGLIYVPVEDGHSAIPDPNCQCGFWLLKDLHAARDKFAGGGFGSITVSWTFGGVAAEPDPEPTVGKVIGEVKGWGRVVIGQDGYRVECASVTAFLTSDESGFIKGDGLIEVAERYAVPVVEAPELNAKREMGWTTVTWNGTNLQALVGGSWHTVATDLTDFAEDVKEELSALEKVKKAKAARNESLDKMRRRDWKRA